MATIATATEKPESKQQKASPKAEPRVQRGRHDDKFKIFCGQ
jgi:hypothetical protein